MSICLVDFLKAWQVTFFQREEKIMRKWSSSSAPKRRQKSQATELHVSNGLFQGRRHQGRYLTKYPATCSNKFFEVQCFLLFFVNKAKQLCWTFHHFHLVGEMSSQSKYSYLRYNGKLSVEPQKAHSSSPNPESRVQIGSNSEKERVKYGSKQDQLGSVYCWWLGDSSRRHICCDGTGEQEVIKLKNINQ